MTSNPPLGTLFAIGGAESKLRRRSVLRAFVAAAGGADARIAVCPSASSLGEEVVDVYRAVFTSLGAGEVIAVRPESRADAYDEDLTEPLGKVSAIFMTGGNQLKLSSFVTGTPFGDAIRRRLPARCRGRRHVGRREHRRRAHDRVRLRRLDPEAADESAVGRSRAVARRGHRPAFRAAQPLRPAVVAGRPIAVPAGDRGGRGHRGRGQRGASDAGGRPRRGHRRGRPPPGLQRLHGVAQRTAADVRGDPARAARRRRVRPDHPHR